MTFDICVRRALPQVTRQARRLTGLPVATLPEFCAVDMEDESAKKDRLKRQIATAFMSGLTRDRRLAIADRGRRARLAQAGSNKSFLSKSGVTAVAREVADQDVQVWLDDKRRQEAAAEQVGFLTVCQICFGDSTRSLPTSEH